jgi:hypothetical protein
MFFPVFIGFHHVGLETLLYKQWGGGGDECCDHPRWHSSRGGKNEYFKGIKYFRAQKILNY